MADGLALYALGRSSEPSRSGNQQAAEDQVNSIPSPSGDSEELEAENKMISGG